jgi:hypothetical protein
MQVLEVAQGGELYQALTLSLGRYRLIGFDRLIPVCSDDGLYRESK